MNTILDTNPTLLETNAAVESVRQAYDPSADRSEVNGTSDRPKPEWVRGVCPQCGDDLVSNWYYIGSRGYIVCWECWSSLGKYPSCSYRKIV